MQFVYGIFFVIAVIIKILWKSSIKVVEVGKDAFDEVFGEIKCQHCGQLNNRIDKFCIHCGKPIVFSNVNNTKSFLIKYCIKCARKNENENKFCIQCGNNTFTNTKYDIPTIENTIGGCVATLSAYIVKADNVVSEAEAELVSKMLTRLSNNDLELKNAFVKIVNEAKNTSIKNHTLVANKLYSLITQQLSLSDREPLYMALGFYFMELVYIDGKFNKEQNTIVVEILKSLKISEYEINNIRREFVHEEKQNYNNYSNQAKSNSLENAYETLNCKSSDSDEIIKKNYKDLAKQFHPDTISGKGLADDFVKFANQRFQEINNAYDTIKKSRRMK